MNGFWAILRKEITQMLRDRGTMFFALLVPVFELILFGVIDMNAKNIPTAIFDQSRTQESRRLVEQFNATTNLRVTQYVLSRGFYALGDTRTPFFLTLVIAGVNAGLSATSYVLLPARWAVTGIAAAYAIACTAGLCCTALRLRRRLGRPLERVLGTHLRLGFACLPGAALAYAASDWFTERLGDGLAGDVSGLVAGAAFIALCVVVLARPLRIQEVGRLVAPLTRRCGTSGRQRRGQ